MIKKHFKKLVSLILAGTLLVVSTTTTFATEGEEISTYNSLLARGYPQTVLENLDEQAIQDLLDSPDLVFAGATIMTLDEETGTFNEYNITADGVVPIYQLPAADLDLVWLYSCSYKSTDPHRTSLTGITVQYSYDWNNLPVFRWQDPIGVAWDNDLFEMRPDSFYKVDKYDGVLTNKAGTVLQSYTGRIKSEEYGYARGFDGGVTWYADLAFFSDIDITKLYGYGKFTLEPVVTTYNGTSIIYGHYVHAAASASLSLNLTDYLSFNVSGGNNYYERGNSFELEWGH